MSSKAHPATKVNLTPTEPGLQENIGDREPVTSTQVSNHEHSKHPELYETPTLDEASPTLEALDISNQSKIQYVGAGFRDLPPFIVPFQGGTMLMEAAECPNMDQGGEHFLHTSKTMHDPPAIDCPTFNSGEFTIQENSSLLFSPWYSLSRCFTIDPHNEPLRHEAGIAVSEGRIQVGQDMFTKRMVELICGIDTLFNEES